MLACRKLIPDLARFPDWCCSAGVLWALTDMQPPALTHGALHKVPWITVPLPLHQNRHSPADPTDTEGQGEMPACTSPRILPIAEEPPLFLSPAPQLQGCQQEGEGEQGAGWGLPSLSWRGRSLGGEVWCEAGGKEGLIHLPPPPAQARQTSASSLLPTPFLLTVLGVGHTAQPWSHATD